MTLRDAETGAELEPVTDAGETGSGVVAWRPAGGWAWYELLGDGSARERPDWGDPEG